MDTEELSYVNSVRGKTYDWKCIINHIMDISGGTKVIGPIHPILKNSKINIIVDGMHGTITSVLLNFLVNLFTTDQSIQRSIKNNKTLN